MAGLGVSVLSWVSLGLPLALAYLALSTARDVAQPRGTTQYMRAAMLCALGLVLPFVGAAAAQGLFSATDCTGGTAFVGCASTSASYGEALFAAFWRGVLYGFLVSGLALVLLVFSALVAWRRWPR